MATPPPQHLYALTTWTDHLVEDKEAGLYLEPGTNVDQVLSPDIEPLLARLRTEGVQIRSSFCLTDNQPLPPEAQVIQLENGDVLHLLDVQAGKRVVAQLEEGGDGV